MRGLIYIGSIVMIFIIIILTGYILLKSVPFEPLVIHDSYFVDDTVCPLQEVTLINDIEIKDGVFSLREAEGFTTWEGDDGRPYGGTFFSEVLEPKQRQEQPSITRRVAPPIEGQWYTERREEVEGTLLGVERTQTEVTKTSNSITVLDWNDEQCKEIRDG